MCRLLQKYYPDPDGRNRVVFIAIRVQTTLIQSSTVQVNFNSVGYFYMHALCFDTYFGHHQACQYKNPTKKDIMRF